MEEFIGAFVTVALGVIVVGAIFQLGKSGNPIVPTFGSVTTTAIGDLFKQ